MDADRIILPNEKREIKHIQNSMKNLFHVFYALMLFGYTANSYQQFYC